MCVLKDIEWYLPLYIMYVCTEYMEVVRHVVNDMSCWTIVEHVYESMVQRYNVSPITDFIRYKNDLH